MKVSVLKRPSTKGVTFGEMVRNEKGNTIFMYRGELWVCGEDQQCIRVDGEYDCIFIMENEIVYPVQSGTLVV